MKRRRRQRPASRSIPKRLRASEPAPAALGTLQVIRVSPVRKGSMKLQSKTSTWRVSGRRDREAEREHYVRASRREKLDHRSSHHDTIDWKVCRMVSERLRSVPKSAWEAGEVRKDPRPDHGENLDWRELVSTGEKLRREGRRGTHLQTSNVAVKSRGCSRRTVEHRRRSPRKRPARARGTAAMRRPAAIAGRCGHGHGDEWHCCHWAVTATTGQHPPRPGVRPEPSRFSVGAAEASWRSTRSRSRIRPAIILQRSRRGGTDQSGGDAETARRRTAATLGKR